MDSRNNSAGTMRCRTVVLEERYAYYRRCQTVRRNGVQCKAPALRGERICCKHQLQMEMQQRWERQRAALSLPERLQDVRSMLRALDVVGEAMIEGRIDEKPARRMLWQLALMLYKIGDRRIGISGHRSIGRSGHRVIGMAIMTADHPCPRSEVQEFG